MYNSETQLDCQYNEQYIFNKLKIYMDQIFNQIIDDKNSNQIQLKSLCQQLQIVKNIISNLQSCRYSSKRELYYQNLYIFENQEQVNKIIQQLSYSLQVQRKQLKIVSASKGLVCGALSIETDNMILDLCGLAFQGKGMNITEFMDQCIMNITGKYILVVEKETVYFRILQEKNYNLLQQIVLITGKGYPCVATKCFIKLLHKMKPQIPICYLGDHDPHGFQIYLYYKYGNEITKYEYNNIPQMTLIQLENPRETFPLTQLDQDVLTNVLDNQNIDNQMREYFNKSYKFEVENCQFPQNSITRFLEQILEL